MGMSNEVTAQSADIFRQNFRRRLRELGMSQRDFAKVADVSDASVSGLMNGEYCPTLKKVDEVAKLLSTNSLYLLTAVDVKEFSESGANRG